ncbi:unnamed protein product [Laminaria digitata]
MIDCSSSPAPKMKATEAGIISSTARPNGRLARLARLQPHEGLARAQNLIFRNDGSRSQHSCCMCMDHGCEGFLHDAASTRSTVEVLLGGHSIKDQILLVKIG